MFLLKYDSTGILQWVNHYGGERDDEGNGVSVYLNNYYLIVGYTMSFGGLSYDFYIVKTDSIGNKVSEYCDGGGCYDELYDILPLNTGDYAVGGYTGSFGNGGFDMFMSLISIKGTPLWDTVYGGIYYEKAFDIDFGSDTGYILAGGTVSFGNPGLNFYVVKIDPSGNLIWSGVYGGPHTEEAHSIVLDTNSTYVIAGRGEVPDSGNSNIYLVKINLEGDSLWAFWYGDSFYDEAWDIEKDSSGNLVIAGTYGTSDTTSTGFLMSINPQPTGIQEKIFNTLITVDGMIDLGYPVTSYIVYDVTGKVMKKGNSLTGLINLQNLNPGVYLIKAFKKVFRVIRM